MKYYIVDDDVNIVKILTNIIEQKDIGEVVGYSYDGEKALKDIILKSPDIVFVDFLMPQKDGNSLVKEIKTIKPMINFIMISQISDKELISEVYKSGIEFFITKPINIIEVEKVTALVAEKIQMANLLSNIKEMFGNTEIKEQSKPDKLKEIKYLLNMLGMLGEKGTGDILLICEYLMNKNSDYTHETIPEMCIQINENPKILKQRIRRAIKKGLINMAYLGIEDFYNDIFQNYSNVFFDFESVKKEMDYVRKKSLAGGQVNIDKFIERLILQSQDKF
ncbi:DNA-binding domain-containing protein [Anaerovorax odorimutans]|uniref:DNA-binding domain-containing protein n=1 Tax=Anaerovorax odorimutans TaxID=109327 RepID=UPI0003F7D12B|nr:DNA-binding domain-containing protein [Anaerovorax odorimutans]